MSQPRRRRRRGRRGGKGSQPQGQSNKETVRETASGAPAGDKGQARSKSSRRRRGRGRAGGGGRQTSGSPKSSEDLVRALPKERPETLTAPPDGQTLEGVIGDLQSTWGVPPYPQEYRIILKVAEEKEARSDAGNGQSQSRGSTERPAREQASDQPSEQGPRREKAPAAPGLTQGAQREKAPRKRRRRRKRGGQGGPDGGGNPGGASGPSPSTGGDGSEGSS